MVLIFKTSSNMKTIKYIDLYNYYKDTEKLNLTETLRNIWRVRQLPTEYKVLIAEILEGKVPQFECNGITLEELTIKDKMTRISAVLFLDWVRRDPLEAMRFMHTDRLRTPLSPLSKAASEMMDEVISKIEDKNAEIKNDTQEIMEEISKEDKSEEDIEVNSTHSNE